jgi:hypothetical protein
MAHQVRCTVLPFRESRITFLFVLLFVSFRILLTKLAYDKNYKMN